VKVTAAALRAEVRLAGLGTLNAMATKTVLTGNPKAENSFTNPRNVNPATAEFAAGNPFVCEAPPHSFIVVKMKTR